MHTYKTKFSVGLLGAAVVFSAILYAAQEINGGRHPSMASSSASDIIPALQVSDSQINPVKIFIGGDIMLDRNVRIDIDKNGFDSIFSDVQTMLQGMDISLANLEGPFTDNPSATVVVAGGATSTTKSLQFTFDPALAPKLRDAGFTLFGLANNHTDNYGVEGLTQTRQYLADAGLGYYGDPDNAVDISTTTTVRGVTIAFVGFHQFSNENFQLVYDEISRLRPLVDYIIVSPHWGVEYQSTSTLFQQQTARAFIDHGADAVIGAHPHVVEQFDMYKGKPIFYSLGNFVFDQNFSFQTTHGLVLEIDLSKNAASPMPASTTAAQFSDVSAGYTFIPITIDNNHPELASPSARADILQNLAAISNVSSDVKNEIVQGKIMIK